MIPTTTVVETARTNPVDVGLDIRLEPALGTEVGDIIVDDHVDLLNVDTACYDVGRNEDLGLAITEAVEDAVSIVRRLFTVQRGDGVTVRGEPLSNLVGGVTFLSDELAVPTTWREFCSLPCRRRYSDRYS